MTISDADTYDDGSEGYVIAPVQTPDLAAALINTATHKGYRMHIYKVTTVDENRHDAARTSTVSLTGHMAPVWGKTLPAVMFDATFTITYSPNHIGAQARNPIVELTALDVTDATDDSATATAVAVIDEVTNTPHVRGSLDDSDLDNMPDQCITFIITQMEHIHRVSKKTPHDLTKDAIEKALTNAAQTTGIAIDIHNIDFGTDHGAEWDNRSPMTVVRGEISLRKLTHITSKFYITFDADTPTPAATPTITVYDMDIELLPHVDDTVCGAFEACDIRITGSRDDAFALVAHMFTSQIQRYMANVENEKRYELCEVATGHPETLSTVKDYQEAPLGTRGHDQDGHWWQKTGPLTWETKRGKFSPEAMSMPITLAVTRWGGWDRWGG